MGIISFMLQSKPHFTDRKKKKKNEAEEKLSKITHLVKRDRIQTEVDSFYVLYVTPRANPFV